MILSKDIIIPSAEDFNSEYIENNLKQQGYDVLRWAITYFDGKNYTVNISYVKE